MIDLKNLTIKKTREMVKNREISCCSLVSAYQENIAKKNKDINAYLEVFDDAFEFAEKQDKKILAGEELAELSGTVFAVKDNILIKGKIASSGSNILEKYRAVYDATVIKKLRDKGANFLGRTNMDEFAMGSSTENSAFGPTRNPYDLERVPGGSSGGSAAAVAMQGCAAALGSDTGGSIRQPASLCGVVGLKPTYGAVSRYGLIAMASSLDQIGPIAKTVEDAEIIFNVIKGKDPADSTSAESQFPISNFQFPKSLRIGLLKYDRKGVNDEVNNAVDESVKILRDLGHNVEKIELPRLEYSLACYYIIMPAEVSSNMARFDGVKYGLSIKGDNILEDYMETRARGFGKEVKKRIALGTYVLSAGYYDEYYGRAQKARALIRKDFQDAFDAKKGNFDIILSPVAPTSAFKIGEKTEDPLQMYLSDIFTVSVNLAGVPAISVPAGYSLSGLPIGIQFIAPWFREDLLFEIGKQYEQNSTA
jgi:aspartyl-tRNA(Asn)/glutamyl-tRNA(Gln) amidotransferase subunit A